jgi:hypothetical protein
MPARDDAALFAAIMSGDARAVSRLLAPRISYSEASAARNGDLFATVARIAGNRGCGNGE